MELNYLPGLIIPGIAALHFRPFRFFNRTNSRSSAANFFAAFSFDRISFVTRFPWRPNIKRLNDLDLGETMALWDQGKAAEIL